MPYKYLLFFPEKIRRKSGGNPLPRGVGNVTFFVFLVGRELGNDFLYSIGCLEDADVFTQSSAAGNSMMMLVSL